MSKETDEKQGQHLAGKYLTFRLRDENYGFWIRPINDIIEMQTITEVPQTEEYVKGVINLRGSVIPVIDLRIKFEMEEGEYDRETCIVVVTMNDMQTGLIVDRVDEVIELKPEEIEPAPAMGHEIKTRFIAGMGKLEEGVIILLDLEKILKDEEAEKLRNVKENSEFE